MKCLHQLFEECAALEAERPAVISGQECLTYGEVDQAASALAWRLKSIGTGPGSIVALYMDRSIELIVAILAVLKAGAAYLPMDRTLPHSRLGFMLEEVEAPILLTQEHLKSHAPPGARRVLPVTLAELMKSSPRQSLGPVSDSDLAYVIYTSGSTGKPKGVLIEHHSVANYISAAINEYGVTPGDRVLQLSSLSFDASIEEMFIALGSGAALILRDDAMISSVATFLEKCAELQISIMGCPTAFWHEVVNQLEQQDLSLPRTLRTVIIGGEQASSDRVKVWQKHCAPGVQLFNTYGPTETTIAATMIRVPNPWASDWVPIGRAIAGNRLHVLGPDLRPVPAQEEGELFIGGSGVARGYLKRPELTAQKFIADPMNPSERLYRTGDLVRILPDGNLLFIGRIDGQVKIGGFRVEIGEIEMLLERHQKVRQSVVLAREDKPGEKQLVAYIVAAAPTSPEELREYLGRDLPNYMVPVHYVFLDKLPVTPNGKIDRRALPKPSDAQAHRITREWRPRNPVELQLQVTFARFFNRTDIGPQTSFFELGGNSLQALRVIVEVERAVGKRLPLGILFKAPTIKELAAFISKENEVRTEKSCLVPLQTGGKRKPFFLVHTTPGDVLGYGNLVYHLDSDLPCYGFQSLGLISPEKAHQSIEEMARHYNRLMRSVQPEGPYYLGGWCYGGIVAMEMAQQLRLAGQEVALLALIETPAPPPASGRLNYNLRRLQVASPLAIGKYLLAKLKYRYSRNEVSRLRFQHMEERWNGEEKGYYEKLEYLYNNNLDAVNKYRSKPYPGRVLLLNAVERDPAIFPDPSLGWAPLVAEIDAFDIPGKHDSILMEPNVQELVQKLQPYLPPDTASMAIDELTLSAALT